MRRNVSGARPSHTLVPVNPEPTDPANLHTSELGLTIGPPVPIDRALCLAVDGEIDMASAGGLETALRAVIREARTAGLAVVVDLDRVTFLDSTGLRVLVVSSQLARAAGIALRVVNPRGNVRRVLQLTGVLEVLTGG